MPPFLFFMPMLFWIVILGGGFYLALRFVRALEDRGAGGGTAAELAELTELRRRLERMAEGVDGTARRLDAMEEAQEFTTRLLTEGPEDADRS